MFLRRDKSQMISAEDARPGRDSRPFSVPARHYVLDTPLEPPFPEGSQQAIFAHGLLLGRGAQVLGDAAACTRPRSATRAAYTPNPTYEEVCSGRTGHTEVVLVVFDPAKVTSYETLLKVFWESHDPTQGMRQGNDVGTQYRSGIYTFDDEQQQAAEASRADVRGAAQGSRLRRRSRPRSLDAPTFYYAEDYHQQYLAKNPMGYCGLGGTGVSCPIGVLGE